MTESSKTKISVIMGVYNERLDWIEKAVDSILNQTYTDFEFIIIVDNPDINEEIKHYLSETKDRDSRVIIEYNSENMGLPRLLNKGIEMASGEYIARMDADDISAPERFDKELQSIELYDWDIVSSQVEYIDSNGNIIGQNNFQARDPQKALNIKNNISHPASMMKTSVIKDLHGYRDMINSEDYDLWLRAIDAGYRIGIINEYLLQYRVRPDGISVSKGLEQFYSAQYIKKLHRQRKRKNTDDYSQSDMNRYVKSKSSDVKMQQRYKQAYDLLTKAIEGRRYHQSYIPYYLKSFVLFPKLAIEAFEYQVLT